MICVFNHELLRSVHRFFNHCSCLSSIDNALSQFCSFLTPSKTDMAFLSSLSAVRFKLSRTAAVVTLVGLSYTRSRPKGGYVGSVTRVILLFLTSCCANIKMPVSEEAHALWCITSIRMVPLPAGSNAGKAKAIMSINEPKTLRNLVGQQDRSHPELLPFPVELLAGQHPLEPQISSALIWSMAPEIVAGSCIIESGTQIPGQLLISDYSEKQRGREMAAAVLKATLGTFVAHALAVACAVMVLVWCISFRGGLAWEATNKSLIFNIHPVLMLIGFIILGGEAIMSYKSLPLKKEVKKVIHLVLHAVALILGIVGISAAFKFHNESSILNLYSLHSWLGIGVIVLYGIQWIYGFVVFFYPGGSTSLRGDSLPWHVLFGMFVYVLAVATAAIGFLEKLTFLESAGLDKFGPEAYLVNFTAIATVLYGAFVVLTVYAQKDQANEDFGYSAI